MTTVPVQPSVSVLMPCLNPGPYLHEAVASVLQQPDCLELLVADGGSSDGSIEVLAGLAREDPRLKLLIEADQGPAAALNRALREVSGTLIGWLNADDLYPIGALARAVAALDAHPDWLMVYGEGEEFNAATGQRLRYPTLQPAVGLDGFQSHCFICQPTVVFRRSMAVLLGPFDLHWRTAFDFDYWLRAFAAFPQRIGYLPDLQGLTRLHGETITSRQRAQVALEATELLARQFGLASPLRLHGYALELQLGLAQLPDGVTQAEHLQHLFDQASSWLAPVDLLQLRRDWLLDPATAPAQREAEQAAAAQQLQQRPSVQLLQLQQGSLRLSHPGPPAGPHSRLLAAVRSQADRCPLLLQDAELRQMTQVPFPPQPASVQPASLQPASVQKDPPPPFGVNLICAGSVSVEVRVWIATLRDRLQAAGLPVALLQPAREAGPYAVNLVCLSPPEHAGWMLQAGLEPLRNRLNLAAWFWIGGHWPQAWSSLLPLVDGIWAPTAAQQVGLAAVLAGRDRQPGLELLPPLPPLPASLCRSEQAVRLQVRRSHQLPLAAQLVVQSVDLGLEPSLTNTFGAVEAFLQAFPQPPPPRGRPRADGQPSPDRPHLVLLVEGGCSPADPEWQWLQARCAADPHLHLQHVGSWSLEQYWRLVAACDVWFSLQRGAALNTSLQAACQLGLQVIVTSHGAAAALPPSARLHRVPGQQVPIPRGADPEADGHRDWTEPDRAAAVMLLRTVLRTVLGRPLTVPLLETAQSGEVATAGGFAAELGQPSQGC
jgi:hypothetical protein